MRIDLIEKYKNAGSKLVLLDYDGTLVQYSSTPQMAVPSDRLFQLLTKLISDLSTKVVIVTGRKHQDIDNLLGNIPIDIAAEHGAIFKENGKWNERVNEDNRWKREIFSIMNTISSEYTGTFTEEKRFSLAWHYRNADIIGGYIISRELIRLIGNEVRSKNLKLIDGNKVVEVMPDWIGKGIVARHLVGKNKYDYVLTIGDDKTDEDMFSALSENENCHTIKVGYGRTFAKYKLDSVNDVLQFLETLS